MKELDKKKARLFKRLQSLITCFDLISIVFTPSPRRTNVLLILHRPIFLIFFFVRLDVCKVCTYEK